MPSENTGNVITAIKFCKDKVVISFKSMKIELTPEAYTSNYYYVGKSFSDKQIEKIEHDNRISFIVKYAKTIIAKKMISEWSLRNKLYEKEYEKPDIDEAIVILKKQKLINDKALCKEYIAYYNEKLYGKERIIRELRLKGIFDETIREIVFSDASELKKARLLFPKLDKQYSDLATLEKKQHIYNAYIRDGYTIEVAQQMIKKVKESTRKQETNKLRRDFALALGRAKRSYQNEDSIKTYVFRTLSQKGYRYQDIKDLWEEN